jgi:hypothetical protein
LRVSHRAWGEFLLGHVSSFPEKRLISRKAVLRILTARFSQVRFEEALCHFLDAGIAVPPQPRASREIELQLPVAGGTVVEFTDIRQSED